MKSTIYSSLVLLSVILLYVFIIWKPFTPDYKIVQKVNFNKTTEILEIKTVVIDDGKTFPIYSSYRELGGIRVFNTSIVDSIKSYEYEQASEVITNLRRIDSYNKTKKNKK